VVERAGHVTREFVAAINEHDTKWLATLMTEDHEFVDALGERVRGREVMLQGWRKYFALMPDYRIEIDNIIAEGSIVGLFGKASGTFTTDGNLRPENAWRIPIALRAIVDGDRVQKWQVFADNKPVYEIMARVGGAK
jgi:ketosteroid isomerase-like protein